MRKYLFGTGLMTAITGGLTLLRGMREDAPFTWRTALGWLSWAIIDPDSPVHGQEKKLQQNRLKRERR